MYVQYSYIFMSKAPYPRAQSEANVMYLRYKCKLQNYHILSKTLLTPNSSFNAFSVNKIYKGY